MLNGHSGIPLDEIFDESNFDEDLYLESNPDVAASVAEGVFPDGRSHFEVFGSQERRAFRKLPAAFREAKAQKLASLEPLMKWDIEHQRHPTHLDFLTPALREQFNIIDTDSVSSHGYDEHVHELIDKHLNGVLLDCGAGRRPSYFPNVVNFEIADYDTTDVRGVGEVLPFVDNAFDAVLSIAVLEHVKDPFLCASEIMRVLKPGGDLLAAVPLLQPVHGYPNHYYNMTASGLENLFEPLDITRSWVPQSGGPIWSLTWIVNSWAKALPEGTRDEFLSMTLGELTQPTESFLASPFVTGLPEATNAELASVNYIRAVKPA